VDSTLRRNTIALGLDFGLFMVGLAFVSHHTVLPAFAAQLGASNVLIGAVPAVMTAGFYLPSLFAAGHTETLPQKLPFVLRYTLLERVPPLGLAAVAFWLAEPAPRLALACVLVLLLAMAGVGGLLMPAWLDVVGRAIPVGIRGRFFAAGHLLGSVGGLLASLLTTYILATLPPPPSYGLCFLAGAACFGLSYLALTRTSEPPGAAPAAPVPFRTYLGRVATVLHRNRNFSRFLVARSLGLLGAMTTSFYAVFALRAHAVADWQVGLFTTILLGGQLLGTTVLGWVGDRCGHRLTLTVSMAASIAANLVAISAGSPETLYWAFGLAGVYLAGIQVSSHAMLLEFAPRVSEQPTYIGLGNTALGPVTFGAPLVAGVLTDSLGFIPAFATAAAFGALALCAFTGWVRDPRRPTAPPAPSVEEAFLDGR
jgi:MFS family permease